MLLVLLTATGLYDFAMILRGNAAWRHTETDLSSDTTAYLAEETGPHELLLTGEYTVNEVTLSGRMMYCGWPYYAWSAGYDTALQRLGILRRGFLDQYAPEEEMIRQVNEYKPDFLYMNKTELMRLYLYCRQHSSKIYQPKFFVPTGEKTDDIARRLFKEVLGPGIIDSYGTAETGACMVKIGESPEYVVHNDSFVVNIYDDNDRPADDGKIVVTPLYKTDLPLINYSIGDKATSVTRNGVRFITGVQGRMNDFFRYETGEVTTFFEIAPIIAHCTDILQIRFIQESYDMIRIQCVYNKEESERTKDEVAAQLTADLNRKFKHPFRIEYDWMDSIPPDENGKLRMIVCKVK